MKPNSFPENMRARAFRLRKGRRGFALVISLSLMVLLTVLAVGLLTLSSVSLRGSGQSEAMQVARSNARMALSLAIGQLQKSAGPDQRITAPAQLAEEAAPKGLTGVWKGVLPTADRPATDKDGNFVSYLVSGAEGKIGNVEQLPDVEGGTILLGEGSLGKEAHEQEWVRAPKVEAPASGNGIDGRYAWTVMDEGTKAKVDIVRQEQDFGNATRQAAMGSPARFGMEAIQGFDGFDWYDGSDQRKLYTIPTSALIDKMPELKKYQHEVTTVHQGLATDAARGGLKKDLSLLFGNGSLPSEYSSQRIYDDESVINDVPNPYWTQAFDYANQYRNLTGANPTLKANVPTGYNPVKYDARSRTYKASPVAPKGLLLMPVVAKVQMQFSMVAKDAHGPWAGGVDGNTSTAGDNYMVYMIYSPIVTLYNPYNVPLSFDQLRIDFKDLPIGFRFYRNGQPQTTTMAHMNQLYVGHETNSSVAKAFGINLRNSYSGAGGQVTLQPGENKVFGESVDGNWSWAANQDSFFDYTDTKTVSIPLAPGYPSQGVGFWVDWLTPQVIRAPADDGRGIFPLSLADSIDVGFGPLPSTVSNNRLSIELNLMRGSQKIRSGTLDLDYGDATRLRTAMSRDPSHSFPNGEARLERPYLGSEMYESPSTKLKDFARAKAFAQFSFYAKTTLESDSPGKPWVQGGQASALTGIDLTKESMGVHPFEALIKRLAPSYKFPCDGQNRGKFFTGHSEANGTRVAPQYEVPLMPLQSLAQLRHAQLCNQGFLPGAAYTVGESFATPMISSSAVAAASTKEYRLLDHAWLANNALWDGYFFSTLAPYGGPLMSSKSLSSVAESFFKDSKPLLNTRMVPAGNMSPEETVAAVTDDQGYTKSAAHLMIDGAFNVNSLSVNAWAALLGSMNQETVDYVTLADGASQSSSGTVKGASFPFSRMRRATGPSVDNANPLQARHARWTGMRTLTAEQIQELAQHVVQEIRENGPFLSLAEFVNRRPGSDREKALEGLLQRAIDETGSINGMYSQDSRIISATDVAPDNYAFPEAMMGMSATGAPGYLTQGDILSQVGSVVSVRSDTFRIRGYGEALDPDGKVVGRAWCEAVVQRTPEFVDPSNESNTPAGSLSNANEQFGRRFVVTNFRWLSQDEV
ncbi:hypothetical protein [Luteolibacter luteus]|uniref:Verru_Chthon cassette protein A n=1 Tax=Luteolibacter luteus TaxID=2728835 RepID=A0A858RN09_9BACT|nr:hypothetical protein [Luteolibacter luteus]QJE97971.1 hypothetical protein HHL09_19995 [Luteolibacter luteus]